MNLRPLARWGLVVVGLAMVVAAVFAPQLGLDSNEDWGPSRRLLLGAGILTVALAWLDRALLAGGQAVTWLKQTQVVTRAKGVTWHFIQSLNATPCVGRIRQTVAASQRAWAALVLKSPFLAATLGNRRMRVLIAAWGAFLVVAASYLWYASVGMWVSWPGTSAYHDMQAEAFLHGQTHLLTSPDPRLLALPNPYDPAAR
ncbi:MAG TPA: hypothetical protein VLL77_03625, partial [Anaerolineales bacterium]|nr:hypothetical protein [Anaerolineales bacterium]